MTSANDAVVVRRASLVAIVAIAVVAGIAIGTGGTHVVNRNAFAAVAQVVDSPWVFTADTACLRLVHSVTRERKPSDESRQNPQSQWSLAQRCAMSEDNRLRMQMVRLGEPTAMQLAMVHFMIPEYHDEQRLKGWDDPMDRRLGPAAGIFLNPFLANISNDKVIPAHDTVPGMLVGFVVVIRQDDEELAPNYRTLHLNWGVNCVWLRRPAADSYEAYISHVPAGASCRSNPTPAVFGPLGVHRTPIPTGYLVRDHAPAARFTDDIRENPLLGVPCYDGWCDIGPPGFTPRPTATYLTTRPPYYGAGQSNRRRETRIKGWYDEQYLEIDSTLWGRGWVATNVRAALVPRRRIHDLPAEVPGQWNHVADVYLDRDPPAGTKYAGALRAGWNKVELRRESAGPRTYTYRYTASNGSTYHVFDIVPDRHQDAPVPGTTRWRYSMFDSGTWAPCGENSCCQSSGF